MHLELVALVVQDYDTAIEFFVNTLGFDLVEDSPSLTNDGRPKRWVVVRPPGAGTGLLLARADGPEQRSVVGNQAAGRVGFFLRADDFDAAYERWSLAGWSSSRLRVPSHMVALRFSATLPVTAGICSARPSELWRQPSGGAHDREERTRMGA